MLHKIYCQWQYGSKIFMHVYYSNLIIFSSKYSKNIKVHLQPEHDYRRSNWYLFFLYNILYNIKSRSCTKMLLLNKKKIIIIILSERSLRPISRLEKSLVSVCIYVHNAIALLKSSDSREICNKYFLRRINCIIFVVNCNS